MSNQISIGEHLKSIRTKANLSQEKLSAKADISPRYYQKIERGASTPSIDILFKIALALDIEYTEILSPIWVSFKSNTNG